MTVAYLDGDLFEDRSLKAYAQGVNCMGAMGAGIAVHFKERYPEMYKDYRAYCVRGSLKLGNLHCWEGNGVQIYNVAVKNHWCDTSDLEFVGSAFSCLKWAMKRDGVRVVGMPRIASGLGGLPWEEVRRVLEHRFAKEEELEVRVYTPIAKGTP